MQKYYLMLKNSFKKVIQTDISPVSEVRVIKTETELNAMQEALKIESAALICFYGKLRHLLKKEDTVFEHQCPEMLD